MRRISILLTYDGTDYHGWQVQPGLATIQGELQAALEKLEGSPVPVHGSGRTDAGVHALGVCAAFNLLNPMPVDNLRRALNRLLPPAIRVLSAAERPATFHPRYDAIAKTYEYRIWREEVCPPFLRRYVHHHPYPLDELAMAAAATLFAGQHDFSAFASADDSDVLGRSKVRSIFASKLWRQDELLNFRVRGSGFLKHMVRHMMGFLIEVGKGNQSPADLTILLAGPPAKAPQSAPAQGLTQISVEYPLP
ncbi:MAG: tRNA pseudouridine(38-40) synthase TruA [Bryobacter sp.]|jgi:tRNA pseudouridine38-40 synthase|nr:tRNA pseudouridine(38-40) synthase TruA [Bryobacter sp. CoA8 C33]